MFLKSLKSSSGALGGESPTVGPCVNIWSNSHIACMLKAVCDSELLFNMSFWGSSMRHVLGAHRCGKRGWARSASAKSWLVIFASSALLFSSMIQGIRMRTRFASVVSWLVDSSIECAIVLAWERDPPRHVSDSRPTYIEYWASHWMCWYRGCAQ